ncbi:MAG: hypothetical protein ACK515_15315 [bacterium]|jgi:hypothetical protein
MSPRDEAIDLLATAMGLMEVLAQDPNDGSPHADEVTPERMRAAIWAIFEMNQRVWSLVSGHPEPIEISPNSLILIGTWRALNAVENAKDSSRYESRKAGN